MLQIALFEHLKANVPLVNNRIFATKAPQDVAKPYIVYQQISGLRENVHGGRSGLAENRIQFSIYAKQYLLTKQVANELKNALQALSGVIQGVRIGTVIYQDEIEDFEQDTGLYTTKADYIFKFKEV